MNKYFYLLSGNIDPARDTDKIHLDMLKETNKEKPKLVLFATASVGTDWHENYKANISNIFAKYNCQFDIIDDPNDNIAEKLRDTDIVYFLGGSPYKHTVLTQYKDLFEVIPIKAGTSAGSIYLGYHTFFAGKDDYVIAIPNMLDFVNLHILPHSETHTEDIVFNYLVNEARISVARIYNQAAIKIEISNDVQIVTTLMGKSQGMIEKVEIVLNNNTFYQSSEDKILNIAKLVN